MGSVEGLLWSLEVQYHLRVHSIHEAKVIPLVSPQNTLERRKMMRVALCLYVGALLLLLLSHFSHVRLCATPSLGFSRQEHWSGLPFPSPMHKSEKWKWSRSVMSESLRPHGLQPTRLLHPWDFPGKSAGVGCHCLFRALLSFKAGKPSAYAEFPKTPMSFQCLIFQLKENNGIFSAVHASLYGMSLGSSLVHIYWDYVFTFFSIIFAQEIFLCTYNEQSTENSNWGDVVIIKS